MHPSWRHFLSHRGAACTESGVTSFGDPAAELHAAAHATIMADLSHLGLLKVEGQDAAAFLQGQLTNDVTQLEGHTSQLAGYCTAKGRLLAIVLAYAHLGHWHLQLNGALTADILERLHRYVLRSKVHLADVSDEIIRIGFAGASAESALQRVLGNAPQQPHQMLDFRQATLIRLPGARPRFVLYADAADAPEIWDALRPNCILTGVPAWQWLDIDAGIPDITPATQDAFVPQSVNLDLLEGISFNKGCYTGQEIVARTHYLGTVKRRTRAALVTTEDMPHPGDPVLGLASQEPVGQVVSAAPAPEGGVALLVEVRNEAVESGPVRLNRPDGPQLHWVPLPYPI